MFKAGDKAINDLNGAKVGVQFGPVKSSGETAYLVEDQGQSYILWEKDMKPTPRFEVGQVVRARYLTGGLAKVAAGPFKGNRCPWYVLELPDGRHSMEIEDDITPVVE